MVGLAGAAGLSGCAGGDGTASPTDRDGTETATRAPTSTDDSGFGTERADTTTPAEAPEPLPTVGGTYREGLSSTITTLNPLYNTEDTAARLIAMAVDPSYVFRPGQRQFPRLFELSTEDDRVWTATLRENLRWSDPYGAVTAADVVYLVEEVHQTEWARTAASSDWYTGGEPISVEETGEYAFEIALPEPDPLFHKRPIAWEMQVVPKELIRPYVEDRDAEGLERDEELNDLSYAGNLGPYDLKRWDRQNRLVFERSDEYYLREADDVKRAFSKAPYFDRLEVRVISEVSSRLGALESGEIDATRVPPDEAVNYDASTDVTLNVEPQPYNRPLFYNQRANGWAPFRRRGVRRALGCAVDKEKYVRGVYRGFATPQYTWQPEWSPWYVEDGVDRYGTGDLYGPDVTRRKMRDALSDTAYEYDGDALVDGDGERVELRLYYQTGQPVEKQTAEFVQREFEANAGIAVETEALGGLRFVDDYWRQQKPENPDELAWSTGVNNYGPRDEVTGAEPWDMALFYGLSTFPMTPTSNERFFLKDGAFNAYGYYPSYDFERLFEEARRAGSRAERTAALGEIFAKVSADQPVGMLALGQDVFGFRDRVRGPVEEYFNGWDFSTWYEATDP